jgi:hypothetical protein
VGWGTAGYGDRMTTLLLLLACSRDGGLTKFNSAPEAQITAPADGSAVLEGSTLTLRGAASDPNHATSTLLARWFVNDAEVCASATPQADGTTVCALTVPETDALAVQLEVLDPEGASGVARVTLPVTANEAPVASVQSPVEGGTYYSDQLVILRALVSDAEDAAESLSVRWESSRDGDLGAVVPNTEGLVESFVSLSEGAHALQVFVTFLGEVGDPDVPASALTVTWSSDKDGLLGTSTPDSDGSVGFAWSALSIDTHRVTLRAVDEVGAECTASVFYTVGTPPELIVVEPSAGDTFNEGEDAILSAVVSDGEDVAGDLVVRWESDVDGVLAEGPPDSTGQSAVVASLSPGAHVLTVTVTDTAGLYAQELVPVRVNGLPSAPGIDLAPVSPGSDEDLVATLSTVSVDPEGDALTYAWTWYRDGSASGASTGTTLPASATARGETWTVEARAFDGRGYGPAGRASVTIGNAAPSVARVTVTPDPATRNDTLTCAWSGYSDADGDSDASTVAWTIDGVPAGTGSTLAGPFRAGAVVLCTVTPNDGTDAGVAVSDGVTISNTAPTLSSVGLAPSSPATNDTLAVSAATSDVDGDGVTLAYAWYVNGSLVAGSGATLSGATSFDRGDTVYVDVTASDGADTTTVRTSTVTVVNTAPTVPVVAIEPEDAEPGDSLVCTVPTPSVDADPADTVTYTFVWTRDGVSSPVPTSTTTHPGDTIDGSYVGSDEAWTCTVTATDGTATTAAVSDDVSTLVDDDLDGYGVTEDCDDTDAAVYPGAVEVCDAVDNDCDGVVDSAAVCGCSTGSYGGHTYIYCGSLSTDWYAAQAWCSARGYDLATIDDAGENSYTSSLIGTAGSVSAWIGLNDVASEGSWVWASGRSSGYRAWGSGEPNNLGNEDCTEQYAPGSSGRWNDMPCSASLRWLCESR